MIRFVLLLLAVGALASDASGQVRPAGDPALARVDSLIGAGNLDDARSSLESWIAGHPPGSAGSGAQAQALFLKGRLATEWKGAEDAYLSVVLGYPTSPHAPAALLLLGKGLLAAASTGSPSTAAIRAASYLERLINDYPGNPLRDEARLWLARAWSESGKAELGCGMLRETLTTGTGPDIAAAMRADSTRICSPDAARPAPPAVTRRSDSTAAARVPPPDSTNAARVAARDSTAAVNPPTTAPARNEAPRIKGRYTVQVAAMRFREGANTIAQRLRDAGFDARVVDLEGSGLIRVRVETFATAADAADLAQRIRARGFDADVVSDVDKEKRQG
ncbi:MAG: SPOR domain-containing protein [Gemmatimonadota bacterium]|jgi:cell division septation protein DedD